jgi:diamine N-acetyltransferase
MIKGNKIVLIPATIADRQNAYEWCFHSETTKSHSGPPDYPENPISTMKEFFDADHGYADHYFTGEHPEKGQGFIITYDGEPVGFISYSAFHLQPHKAEMDIWLKSEAACGKGYGTDAIIALGDYLNQHLGIMELIMRPSLKNLRANRSYEKAGLFSSGMRPEEYLLPEYVEVFGDGDYGEGKTALLVKRFRP